MVFACIRNLPVTIDRRFMAEFAISHLANCLNHFLFLVVVGTFRPRTFITNIKVLFRIYWNVTVILLQHYFGVINDDQSLVGLRNWSARYFFDPLRIGSTFIWVARCSDSSTEYVLTPTICWGSAICGRGNPYKRDRVWNGTSNDRHFDIQSRQAFLFAVALQGSWAYV